MTSPFISRSAPGANRADFALIASLIPMGARVLDVGCGDGALLELLEAERAVDGRGIELSQAGVNACVARGLSVIQGDADTDLALYPDGAFDFAILSQTIQATHRPRDVLQQMLRVGKRAIVSIPNFGHWRVRLALAQTGRMPETAALPARWYETANIHLCSLADFEALCAEIGVTVERAFAIWSRAQKPSREIKTGSRWSNLTAEVALFLLAGR